MKKREDARKRINEIFLQAYPGKRPSLATGDLRFFCAKLRKIRGDNGAPFEGYGTFKNFLKNELGIDIARLIPRKVLEKKHNIREMDSRQLDKLVSDFYRKGANKEGIALAKVSERHSDISEHLEMHKAGMISESEALVSLLRARGMPFIEISKLFGSADRQLANNKFRNVKKAFEAKDVELERRKRVME
ncbi:hypothetical protein HY989_06305 [Candidatus Micrarchaeota archaeon]|nr:hypothetical protein [Candidatus Micrarchaeota archaeon]